MIVANSKKHSAAYPPALMAKYGRQLN